MATQKRGLGKGLGALIQNTSANQVDEVVLAQAENGIRLLSVNSISPNPQQPRTHFDEATLAELAASIQEHGIIQPLIVTQSTTQGAAQNSTKEEQYWLIAGERRWRAALRIGLDELPVIVREASQQQLMEWALVENIQRDDLNPLEEAIAYQALLEEYKLTQTEVAKRVGKSRPTIANTIRLLQLSKEGLRALTEQRISAGHARTMLALPEHDLMDMALREILAKELSVRQTEALIKRILASLTETASEEEIPDVEKRGAETQLESHFADLESRFRSSLGTRVNLNRNNDGTGRLVIHFYNDDDLQSLYQAIVDE